MHDPETLVKDFGFFQIWHVDPCKGPGGDDSCGWFMRAHHGDDEVLEKIVREFAFDWDRTFDTSRQGDGEDDEPSVRRVYNCGLFKPNGDPHLSVMAIALNLFWRAASVHFKSDGLTNWKRANRFMKENLFDIMLFAENTLDSLHDGITRKFEKGCGEEYGIRARQERIRNMAACIYGWILRSERPWYRHPRWHIHHWRINIPMWYRLKRFFRHRCKLCGKRISIWDNGVVSHSWSGNGPYECGECSSPQCAKGGG